MQRSSLHTDRKGQDACEQLKPLKIALVGSVDNLRSDWQAMVIDRLHADERFELVGWIAGGDDRGDQPLSASTRGILRVERALIGKNIRAYDITAASSKWRGLRALDESLEGEKPDIALALGNSSLSNNQLSLAHDGEWALSFAGAANPLWIAMDAKIRQAPLIGVEILQRNSASPWPTVVSRTGYNPKPGTVLTGAFTAEKAVLFLIRRLADYAMGTIKTDAGLAPEIRPDNPGPNMLLNYTASFAGKVIQKLMDRWRIRAGRGLDFWRLAIGNGGIENVGPEKANVVPRHAFTMADPFLFENAGEIWLFYEALGPGIGNGWIETAKIVDGKLETPVEVLKCDYHLSYPFVFRDGGEIYMMPETQQSKRLEVWRAVNFPTRWELHATAFEGQCLADSSLFRTERGHWWLLTNLSDHFNFQDHSSELYLFSVDGPNLNSITPHPGNPVVIGSGVARNAGSIIAQDGRLFRPSQNNSFGVYGHGLNIMEILQFDETTYEERAFRQLTPEAKPGCTAMHHLSCTDDVFVIDIGGREGQS